MKQYLDALNFVLDNGTDKPDRTGTGIRSVFGYQMRFDMANGFPAMTTKKLMFDVVSAELLWFISGSSDNNKLIEMGCNIWTANANADYWKPKAKYEGDLGRVYGVQWRHSKTPDGDEVDQLAKVIEEIKAVPSSADRRLIVSAWNPGELDQMALPPCHTFFQFYVTNGRLSLQMYQRSADLFLGVPFNIASYALLLHMVAQVCDLEVGDFVHTFGDFHIYSNHFKQVEEQLERKPKKLPTLWLNPEIKDIDKFTTDDIKLENYKHDSYIKAPMAV